MKDKISGAGPKKLLAIDGGGIRVMLSIEVLAKIEALVGKRLCDYFDYIGGTSTGAIIATCLSLGMSVSEIREFYVSSGAEMFSNASFLQRFRNKYEDEKLASKLKREFARFAGARAGEEVTLGSDALKTLLLVVLRNATTDSHWPLSNNPRAKYNDLGLADCNLNIPLWQVVRASTAAPTYFPPERIALGAREYLFVDGGVTMYNNPSFLMFLMSTLPQYQLGWKSGPEDMLIVSVGTGAAADANKDLAPSDVNLLYHAASLPSALIFAALNEQDMLCRVFGRCLHGGVLDGELDALLWSPHSDSGSLPKLFTYVRYNADLSRDGLDALGLPHVVPAHVQALDSVEHIAALQAVGSAVAEHVKPAHFAGFA
jgi:hypothetical protein